MLHLASKGYKWLDLGLDESDSEEEKKRNLTVFKSGWRRKEVLSHDFTPMSAIALAYATSGTPSRFTPENADVPPRRIHARSTR